MVFQFYSTCLKYRYTDLFPTSILSETNGWSNQCVKNYHICSSFLLKYSFKDVMRKGRGMFEKKRRNTENKQNVAMNK